MTRKAPKARRAQKPWHPGRGRCTQPPHKRSYPTRHLAKQALHEVGHGSLYRCPVCRNYHLTTIARNVQRAINYLLASIAEDRKGGKS